MNLLTEKLFTGTWRSYKAFLKSGSVRLYNLQSFIEMDFKEDNVLTIVQYTDAKAKRIIKTDNWTTEFSNKRHFLIIQQGVLSYEVITINHTALVLLDNNSNEKLFFAKLPYWETIIRNNTTLVF